jgi:YjbR
MISELQFIEIVLAFPNTERVKHFDRIGIKVKGKRMFCTYLDTNNTANLFLTPAQQQEYCEKDPDNFFPVPNKWGEHGATTVELDTISKELLIEALTVAYNEVNKPKRKKKTRN